MWYVLHGPDVLARDEELARMKAKLGEPDLAALNFTRLEREATLRDLTAACDALPFLAEKRLVVAVNWLSSLGSGKGRGKRSEEKSVGLLQALLTYLPTMPDTTRLVFAEDVTLSEDHPLLKQADTLGGVIKHYGAPADPARWVIARTKAKGGEISPQAAQLLASKISAGSGDRAQADADARQYLLKLDSELDKLVSYALGRRIESRDVELLVQGEESTDIFKFIDAISARDAEAASRAVRGLLARGEPPLVVLSHLARQTRLLIQTKEHPNLSPEKLAQTIGVHPFVARKLSQQANRFSIDELERTHIALLQADLAIKTGNLDDVTALDLLVAQWCA
jgi:DNA polymerase-3 subunit delta